jgi:hypothetical protein
MRSARAQLVFSSEARALAGFIKHLRFVQPAQDRCQGENRGIGVGTALSRPIGARQPAGIRKRYRLGHLYSRRA